MDDFIVTAAALKLGYAALGVLACLLFSVWLDRRARVDFRAMLSGVVGNATASAIYYGARWLGICLLFGALAGCASAHAGPVFPSRYDAQIRSAVEQYWPDHPDWLAWRAQLYQESRLRPDAVSAVGAAGLAQIMPDTWQQVARELRLPPGASPHQDIAIQAGAYYMARLRRVWSSPRTSQQRHELAQASYNAGAGNIIRAQSRCGGITWSEISPCLVQVTGRYAAETLGYVAAIARWRAAMAAGA